MNGTTQAGGSVRRPRCLASTEHRITAPLAASQARVLHWRPSILDAAARSTRTDLAWRRSRPYCKPQALLQSPILNGVKVFRLHTHAELYSKSS